MNFLMASKSHCDECTATEILETQKPLEWERTIPQGRTYHIYNYPFADIDGSPMVLKLGMDITERKALEAQLLAGPKDGGDWPASRRRGPRFQ